MTARGSGDAATRISAIERPPHLPPKDQVDRGIMPQDCRTANHGRLLSAAGSASNWGGCAFGEVSKAMPILAVTGRSSEDRNERSSHRHRSGGVLNGRVLPDRQSPPR